MPRSTERPGRLPSLRGPRDLTLGGVRKKTFTPNIPVRKERSKQEQKTDEVSTRSKKDGSRRDRQRGRGRGRGRGRPEIIQSHSIFEAGPSAEPVAKRNDAGFGTGGGGGASKDAIEKPSIKQEIFDEDLEKSKTEEALKNLEGDSLFIADLENDDSLMPTSLPMFSSLWPPGAGISKQTMNDPESSIECSNVFLGSAFKQEAKDPTDVLIFQLPDTLPAVPPSTDTHIKTEPGIKIEPGKVKQEPGLDVANAENKHCTLEELSEGYVGKLQVMKSGKCRLLLGNIILDLTKGTHSSFQEELVSVRLPPEGQDSAQGHMTVLGNISNKIICTPDMEHLIRQTQT
ncbi:DNA-directed RNA polymerase III subunit RPC4-like [Styela clava]|uniref:DNA-directed RNA polymerase III subunit RPC4-like n=1 Tax=Styela clava TaxID=7725 RepID=UPI00193A11BF|nr:DNA-directed RNA polymerase III subunit RPC4-like [Styela clava]